jgi:transcription termination/antitermination protein NusG
MLIDDPSDTRTDTPDEASADEAGPPPESPRDESGTPADSAETPEPSPDDVGASPELPVEPDEAGPDEAGPGAQEEMEIDPGEAVSEELSEPTDQPAPQATEEVTPALEREETPAEVEAVTVQAPEEQATAEAETPDAEAAAEESPRPEAEAGAEPEAEVEEAAAEAEEQPEAEPEEEEATAPATAVGEPFGGPGDWYVIHTYAGYENKVKTNLESRIHTMQMEGKIFDVHIPMEDVMEIKGGKKQVVQKKVFPGYLLVKMVYDDDSWYVVRNTPGVTGFVSSGTGQKPTPLSRREVEKILTVKEEEAKKPAFRLEFEEGDVVRIISGPFADFNGTISDINVDQSKLRVMVNIFDRETPVELGFDQVAKV